MAKNTVERNNAPLSREERERARQKRKKEKQTRNKAIAIITLVMVMVVLCIMRVCEIDFQSYKNRHTDQNGKFSLTVSADSTAYPFKTDTSNIYTVTPLDNKMMVLSETSLLVFNPINAKAEYSFVHGFSNPVMSSSGSYVCLIDQGANRLRLDKTDSNVYESKTADSLLCADVSKNGTVMYATRASNVKSKVYVENQSRKKLLELDVNDGYVVSVAIDSTGRKCAYATINSKDAKLVTTVHTVNVGEKSEKASIDFEDTNVMAMRYGDSSNLYFVGDNRVAFITSQKKSKDVFEKGSITTETFCFTDNNELLLDYSEYSKANESTLVKLSKKGGVKELVKLDKRVKFLSSSGNEACVLTGDKISIYSLSNGKEKKSITCDDSLTSANKYSSSVLVSRHQLIDVMG